MSSSRQLRVTVEEIPWGVIEYKPNEWRQVGKFRLTGTYEGASSPVLVATVTPLGAALVSLLVSDGSGMRDVVLGFDHPEDYLKQDMYAGVTVGRNASRVGESKFALDGRTYHLTRNTPGGHLHGGTRGFGKVMWTSAVNRASSREEVVTFTYVSRDGEEGYPGDVMVAVTYRIVPNEDRSSGALQIAYRGMSNSPTPLNLTSHLYFNLAGHESGADGMAKHRITLKNCSSKLVLEGGIAKGDTVPLQASSRGSSMMSQVSGLLPDVMTAHGGEIDDVFPLDLPANNAFLVEAASLSVPITSTGCCLRMLVKTTQPALVVYTANYVDNVRGKDGAVYVKHGSVAMETSGYPNAMNVPEFPSVVLRPGQLYEHTTSYGFDITRD